MNERGPHPRRALLAAMILALAVSVVFFPILGFEFVNLDVNLLIVDNPYVHGLTLDNLWHIFTTRCIRSYYPVRTLTYAIDHQLWGLRPWGFELTNALLHLANVLLLFWLILRHSPRVGQGPSDPGSERGWREIGAAAFAAALLAIHPVVVEPVVWLPGREELLMTLGALATIHFHVTARRIEAAGPDAAKAWPWRLAAVAACAAACLSNAVGAMIPLLVVAYDRLMDPRPTWKRTLAATAPLFAMAVATVLVRRTEAVTSELDARESPLLSAHRWMLVLNVFGLNLGSLVWPAKLACDYGRIFPNSFLDPPVILGGLAAIGVATALWCFRRQRQVLLGLAWFLIALAPSAQLVPHHNYRADRFLYLPLAGLAWAVAMALGPLHKRIRTRAAAGGAIALGMVVLLPLMVRSIDQVPTWRNSRSMWENCVRVVPHHAIAHCALANQLLKIGQFEQARRHYEISLELGPCRIQTLTNFAGFLMTCQRVELRDYPLAVRLADQAFRISQGKDERTRYILARAYVALGSEQLLRQQTADAIGCFRAAVEADPNDDQPRFKLAGVLATCSDARLRDPEEAVRQAETGLRLVQSVEASQWMVLAEAYAATKRYGEAAAAIEKAMQIPEVADNHELARELQGRWGRYRQLGWNAGKDGP